MLEGGAYATIREIAAPRRSMSLRRVLRLTLLAPDIVEAIFDGRRRRNLQLDRLMRRFPIETGTQREVPVVEKNQ